MWKCKKCGEELDDTFDDCWNCGTSKEGYVPQNLKKFRKTKKEISRMQEPNINITKSIKRPKTVTVIFWFFIIYVLISALLLLVVISSTNLRSNVKGSMIYFVVFSIAYPLFIALGLREGINWVRILYLTITPISIIFTFLKQEFGHIQILFGSVLYLVFLFFLTRPKVIAFFKQNELSYENLYLDNNKKNDEEILEKPNNNLVCLNCIHFQSNLGVCTYFHFNVKLYPKKFEKRCGGKYLTTL